MTGHKWRKKTPSAKKGQESLFRFTISASEEAHEFIRGRNANGNNLMKQRDFNESPNYLLMFFNGFAYN